jgi:threonine/homoserine/homoserine lactone efflux protein
MTLKVAGAIYLLYLAWQVLAAEPLSLADNAAHRPDIAWSYRRGIIMNITNPKVSLFFLAFLPQFVTPEANAVALQIFALGGLFILATIFVFGTIAIMAAVISASLISSARWQKNLNRLAALVFVLLATHLIFTA